MISSLQDNIEISAQAVVYSLIPIFYMLPLGVAIGSGVVVGQKIGERREEEVRRLYDASRCSETVRNGI